MHRCIVNRWIVYRELAQLYSPVLAISCFHVKLLQYISYIPLLTYFHVCSGIQLKGKTTFMSFLCELDSHIPGQQNAL